MAGTVEGVVARIKRLMSEAADAVEASTYDVAIVKATSALALMASVPRQSHSNSSLEFTSDSISKFIEWVKVLQNASVSASAGGLQAVKCTFGGVSE